MAISHTGLTVQQFLDLPEEKPALEYAHGEVTRKVSPKADHSFLQTWLPHTIASFAGPRRLGIAFSELRVTLGTVSRVPDVAFYRRERVARDARGRIVKDFLTPPDVVIEIRSPGQTLRSQLDRCREFLELGVPLAIAIDPDSERVWVLMPGQPERELSSDEPIDFGDILPEFLLTPRDIFASLTDG